MSRLPYYSPPDSNEYLLARQVVDPETGQVADIQQVDDAIAQERLLTQITRQTETRDNVATAVARLEAIRDSVATAARQDTQIARLETLRDTVYRRTDPLPTGPNFIGFTSPDISRRVQLGQMMLSSTGRINLAVTGSNLRVTIANPATSGKTMSVIRIAGFTSSGNGFASIILNPTTGLPASPPRPILNGIAGGGVPATGQLRVDISTTAMAGGIDTGIVIGIPGNTRFQIDLPPVIAAPGVTLGVNIPYTATGDVTLSAYWIES